MEAASEDEVSEEIMSVALLLDSTATGASVVAEVVEVAVEVEV